MLHVVYKCNPDFHYFYWKNQKIFYYLFRLMGFHFNFTDFFIMVMCFILDCKHYSEQKTCKFFVFSGWKKTVNCPYKVEYIETLNTQLYKTKLIIFRRQDREPSKHSLVCNCHFVNKDRKNWRVFLLQWSLSPRQTVFFDVVRRQCGFNVFYQFTSLPKNS